MLIIGDAVRLKRSTLGLGPMVPGMSSRNFGGPTGVEKAFDNQTVSAILPALAGAGKIPAPSVHAAWLAGWHFYLEPGVAKIFLMFILF